MTIREETKGYVLKRNEGKAIWFLAAYLRGRRSPKIPVASTGWLNNWEGVVSRLLSTFMSAMPRDSMCSRVN